MKVRVEIMEVQKEAALVSSSSILDLVWSKVPSILFLFRQVFPTPSYFGPAPPSTLKFVFCFGMSK